MNYRTPNKTFVTKGEPDAVVREGSCTGWVFIFDCFGSFNLRNQRLVRSSTGTAKLEANANTNQTYLGEMPIVIKDHKEGDLRPKPFVPFKN